MRTAVDSAGGCEHEWDESVRTYSVPVKVPFLNRFWWRKHHTGVRRCTLCFAVSNPLLAGSLNWSWW